MTPPLPESITGFRLDGYTNVYELCPGETRLYGTEDLFGDWNGRVLLVAKDFACSSLIRDRIDAGDPRPYRHEPKLVTNRRLLKLAAPLRTGESPETCGLLYGSALASLCRDDDKMSGTLPNRTEAMRFGEHTLAFTIGHMPNLQAIVCMGDEAWRCASGVLKVRTSWADARDGGGEVRAGRIGVFAAYHPAARVSKAGMQRPWEAVVDVLAGRRAA